MREKLVLVCVGTRPNLIKITGLEKAFAQYPNLKYMLLHTGQHYDTNMNDVFFEQLKIKKPDFQFKLSATTQVSVIAEIMEKFAAVCEELKPDMVMVPGDVNSSFACAFVAQRMGITVAHIESGLRSFDRSMPEELNRILIDDLSDLHFITELSGTKNLLHAGFDEDTIKYVGNSMIDSLVLFKETIAQSSINETLGLNDSYAVFTFHRPVNVDNRENLMKLISLIEKTSEKIQVVFPVHPRTIKQLKEFALYERFCAIQNVVVTEPQGYIPFLKLITDAKFVITDSGGVQEETTFLGVPCLTIRPNTERPVTTDIGTNTLMEFEVEKIGDTVQLIMESRYKKGIVPELWDGRTAERIVQHIAAFFEKKK